MTLTFLKRLLRTRKLRMNSSTRFLPPATENDGAADPKHNNRLAQVARRNPGSRLAGKLGSSHRNRYKDPNAA